MGVDGTHTAFGCFACRSNLFPLSLSLSPSLTRTEINSSRSFYLELETLWRDAASDCSRSLGRTLTSLDTITTAPRRNRCFARIIDIGSVRSDTLQGSRLI